MNEWPVVALGDLCSIALGATPPRGSPRFWDIEKVTSNVWLSIADMPSTLHAAISDSKEYLSDEGAARGKVVKEGTLLVSFKLTLGRLAYAGRDLRTNEAIAALSIRDAKRIKKEYLYWYLTYFDWQKAAEGEDKVKGKTLNKEKLKALPVFVPPLDEQRRIVAVLDEAFAAIVTSTANAEKNLANARGALDAWLRTTTQSAPDRNWTRRQLGDLATKIGSGATPRGGKEAYLAEGIPLVRSLNVHDRRFKPDQLAYLDDTQGKQLSNVTLQQHDVLLNITGASVARCCLLPDNLVGGRVNQHVSIIRTKHEVLNPKFLELLLTSPTYKARLLGVGNAGGSTRQAITKTEIQGFEIELPPMIEQRKIVETARELEQEIHLLLRNFSCKVDALAALKQSFLENAFSGERSEREIEPA